MGKASSAKKVARAARAGGSKKNRPKLGFPVAVVAVALFGLAIVVGARTTHSSAAEADTAPSYRNKDHWHSPYIFYTCDKVEPSLRDTSTSDVDGIHTHEDGIIHNHPFKASSSGTGARLNVWAKIVGLKFYDDGWKLPDGRDFRKGSATCNDKPAKVAVYKWKLDDKLPNSVDVDKPVEVYESNFGNINLSENNTAYTFAVLPEGASEPPPKPDDGISKLCTLEDNPGACPQQQTDPAAAPTDPAAAGGAPTDPAATGAATDPAATKTSTP